MTPAPVAFTDPFLRRFLTVVLLGMTAVVVGVAAAAFFTSFEAIRAFAETSGGIKPEHAWLAPLLVDSFIFIASAADLWLTVTGSNKQAEGFTQHILVWSPKALLALAAAGSFALNVAHAQPHVGARVVAMLAPIALVLTFEMLMLIARRAAAARVERVQAPQVTFTAEQVERVVRRAVSVQAAARAPRVAPTARGALPTGPPRVRPQPEREGEAHAPGGTDRSSERARVVREHLKEHPGESANAVKKMLQSHPVGVGNTTRLYELVAQVKAESNGSASKVEVGT